VAGTTTITLPAATDTLVGKATTDTLTNKTLTTPVISTISNTGTLTLPTSTDTLVGRATTDTLTNKTLTAPTLASANITTALTLTGASGTNGQALTSAGSGLAPTWTTIAASPGGSTTQLQYNNAGAFAGISGVTSDGTRMTASTTIGVGGATPSTSGSGITFPATQSASSNANTLDDYEEGTWTPIDSSGNGLNFNSVNGYYTKIGDMVFATLQLIYPASVGSFTNLIGGLPFTVKSGDDMNGFHVAYTDFTSGLISPLNSGLTSFTLYNASTGNSINNTSLASKLIRGTCIYKV
jgi:hypothetical protein